jgi:hypothetical protein
MERRKKYRWLNKYYVIITGICILLALFIWLLFRSWLADLEKEKRKETQGKSQSPVNK